MSPDSLTDRPSLDPSPEEMRRLGYDLIDRIVDHMSTLRDQSVVNPAGREAHCQQVDEPLPDAPSDITECLDFLFQHVVPDMTLITHPRFHAYIPGPSSFVGAMGGMLASGLNPFVGTWLGGATVSALEATAVRWLAEMIDCRDHPAGVLTSGGSIANLIGLAAGRTRGGTDSLKDGVVYASSEGHASIDRAARILGFPDDAIRSVPVNAEYRMNPDALDSMMASDLALGKMPLIVCANAGTTNLGVVDDLPTIADVCEKRDAWLHVDAAYGGLAALTETGKRLLEGLDRADSITLDPHKWLYCPVGVGCVLVRDREALRSAFSMGGSYLRDLPEGDVNFFEMCPELSRPARVFSVWMVIRAFGRDQLAHQIGEDMRLARLAADLLSEDERLEVIPPELSVVAFRHRSRTDESETDRAARDARLLEAIMKSGDVMLSSTTVGGLNTLRLVVMNHRTTEADIRYTVSRIRSFAV